MDVYLLVGSLLTLAAVLSTRLTQHFGVPALVLFVVIGMLAGSGGPGGFEFADYGLSLELGLIALAVILLRGGLGTRAETFRQSILPASLLATVGIVVKMLVVGGLAHLLTPLTLLEGLLLGAVLAPTDAAAVFSVLKGSRLPARIRGTLETESGTNDPMSIYLTLTLTAFITTGQVSIPALLGGVVVQLALGGLLGYLFGRFLVWLINRSGIDTLGLYPVLVLSGGLLAYAATNLVGGNGFLAIYVLGVVLGNFPLSHKQGICHFMDGFAWGAQITMFLLLGLLVFPEQLVATLPLALLLTLVVLALARPLAVYLSLAPLGLFANHDRFTWQEQLLLSWAGLKGAVPIILAMVPLLNQVPSGEVIFNIVFVVVIVGTTVQALTVVPLATRLGLAGPGPLEPPVCSWPDGSVAAPHALPNPRWDPP